MLLDVSVVNQRVFIKEYNYIVNDSIDYLYCHFCFSDEWEGVKTAIFKTADKAGVYHILIDENNLCRVPEVCLKSEGFYLSVFCGNLITADEKFIKTEKSGYSEGGEPPPPEKDIYNQIIELLNNISGAGGGGIVAETDPTVPAWAKEKNKPVYTAEEVGAVSAEKEITNTEILEILGVM